MLVCLCAVAACAADAAERGASERASNIQSSITGVGPQGAVARLADALTHGTLASLALCTSWRRYKGSAAAKCATTLQFAN